MFYAILTSKDGKTNYNLGQAGNTRLEAEVAARDYAKANGLVVQAIYKTVNARTANKSRLFKPTWK